MNQDLMNQIKQNLNEFPTFLKELLKSPMGHIDREPSMDLVKVLLYGFLVEAITNTIYSISILNISGIATSLIFSPIQTMMIIAFVAFLVWFALDRIGFSQTTFLHIFRVLVIAEMIISLAATPVMIALAYVKSVDFIYLASMAVVIGKAYLIYRGLTRQIMLSNKRALIIVSIFSIIFLAPIVSNFFDGYSIRRQVRDKQKLHEIQMEQSIEELEKELGGE